MKKWMVLFLVLTFGTTGCVHLDSVSTSSVPADRSKPVEAEASRFLFLLFNFNNDYVDTMSRDLARQCPAGRVEGILTKQEWVTYFPLFAHRIRVTASGYCLKDGAVQ